MEADEHAGWVSAVLHVMKKHQRPYFDIDADRRYGNSRIVYTRARTKSDRKYVTKVVYDLRFTASMHFLACLISRVD